MENAAIARPASSRQVGRDAPNHIERDQVVPSSPWVNRRREARREARRGRRAMWIDDAWTEETETGSDHPAGGRRAGAVGEPDRLRDARRDQLLPRAHRRRRRTA